MPMQKMTTAKAAMISSCTHEDEQHAAAEDEVEEEEEDEDEDRPAPRRRDREAMRIAAESDTTFWSGTPSARRQITKRDRGGPAW